MHSPVNLRSFARNQAGVTLLEVMISVLIMAVGMLGIAAMQTTSLRNTQSSMERSQAVIQSYSIIDAMRVNRVQARAGRYNTSGMACAVPEDDGSQSAADRHAWMTSLKNSMGNGAAGDTTTCGDINCTAAGVCTVIVQWDDQRGRDISGSASETQQVRTVVLL